METIESNPNFECSRHNITETYDVSSVLHPVSNNYRVEVVPLVHNTCIGHGPKVTSIHRVPSYLSGSTSWYLANYYTTSALTQMSYNHWLKA
jgi:hypothetical protein